MSPMRESTSHGLSANAHIELTSSCYGAGPDVLEPVDDTFSGLVIQMEYF